MKLVLHELMSFFSRSLQTKIFVTTCGEIEPESQGGSWLSNVTSKASLSLSLCLQSLQGQGCFKEGYPLSSLVNWRSC